MTSVTQQPPDGPIHRGGTIQWPGKLARYADAYAAIAKAIPDPEYTENIQSNAQEFYDADEGAMEHYTGCTDWQSMRAAVFAIEAVRNMNGGSGYKQRAITLLKMALEEMEQIVK